MKIDFKVGDYVKRDPKLPKPGKIVNDERSVPVAKVLEVTRRRLKILWSDGFTVRHLRGLMVLAEPEDLI